MSLGTIISNGSGLPMIFGSVGLPAVMPEPTFTYYYQQSGSINYDGGNTIITWITSSGVFNIISTVLVTFLMVGGGGGGVHIHRTSSLCRFREPVGYLLPFQA